MEMQIAAFPGVSCRLATVPPQHSAKHSPIGVFFSIGNPTPERFPSADPSGGGGHDWGTPVQPGWTKKFHCEILRENFQCAMQTFGGKGVGNAQKWHFGCFFFWEGSPQFWPKNQLGCLFLFVMGTNRVQHGSRRRPPPTPRGVQHLIC